MRETKYFYHLLSKKESSDIALYTLKGETFTI
jgi:hypothetical protein